MTNLPNVNLDSPRRVLVSHGLRAEGRRWLREVDDLFRPSGFVVCRAHSGPETIRRVEEGGLAGAVLIEDRPLIDGLSLLRIIRSIDLRLPCWLVTEHATRRTLEAALSLRVVSVMTPPVDVGEFTRAMRTHLSDPAQGN